MPTTLSDLMHAPGLDLRQVGAVPADTAAVVRWVAVTEVLDPGRFLSGGELVLTTGVRQRSAAQQRDFTTAVAQAGATALGYGTGLGHRKVPAAVVQCADSLGLPLVEVPLETPFIALSHLVADRQVTDHVARLTELMDHHQRLAESLLSGRGVSGFVHTLAGLVGGRAALERYGTVVHRAAAKGVPPVEDRGSGLVVELEGGRTLTVPVATGLPDRCRLHLWTPDAPGTQAEGQPEAADHDPLTQLAASAQNLLTVRLSSDARTVEASRRLAGEVLQDVVDGSLHGQEAAVRLAALGVDAAARHVVVAVESQSSSSARLLASLPLPAQLHGAATALVEDRLIAVVPSQGVSGRDGELLMDHLERAGIRARAGAGASYPRPEGLRWSYYEALEALHDGTGFTQSRRLTMASLLMSAQDVPLADLAAEALDPLKDSDRRHHTDLIRTLTVYLESDGQAGEVARQLGIHRNTVRYRLQQVAELSGFDPTVTAGRVHLWLALAQERQSRGRSLDVSSLD